MHPFSTPLKTSENQHQAVEKGLLGTNGLILPPKRIAENFNVIFITIRLHWDQMG